MTTTIDRWFHYVHCTYDSMVNLFQVVFSFKFSLFPIYYSYRIRLPTEKELEMKVSKEVKKMRYFESTLLTSYRVSILSFMFTINK